MGPCSVKYSAVPLVVRGRSLKDGNPPVEYVRDHILKHFRDDDLETVQLVSDEGLTGVVVLLWRHDHSRARVQVSASVGAVGCTYSALCAR